MRPLDPDSVADSPCWVIDLCALEDNLRVLDGVQREAGCKVLLALKGFATFSTFDLVGRYLSGAAVSSPFEARLAHEHMEGGEVHAYAPAYSRADMVEVLKYAGHVNFNSPAQWRAFGPMARQAGASCGLRINPEHREVEVALYDPCAPGSRLGTTLEQLEGQDLSGLDGLHMHTLCELGSDALARTLEVVERRFASLLSGRRWLNLGGGHHITKPDYDRALLVELVRGLQQRHGVEVYLEPGEAVAIGTGALVTTVLDIVRSGDVQVAILDCSATAHMPDVLEMPYRPDATSAGAPGELAHTYRLGGLTCLAGDVVGDYSFAEPLQVGQRLVFEDMAHYTTVKTSSFNGVRLPSLALWDRQGPPQVVRRFGYDTYQGRL